MPDISRRLANLEVLLERAAQKHANSRDLPDNELWTIILGNAGQPITQDNIVAHEAYNDTHTDTLWINIDGEWTDALANRPSRRRQPFA